MMKREKISQDRSIVLDAKTCLVSIPYWALGLFPLTKLQVNHCQKPADHDKWLECLGCGTVYAKYEVKQEPHLTTLIDPDTDPFDRDKNIIESVRERRKFDRTGKTQLKKKRKQELNNIKDSGLKRELQTPGTELVSYEVSREY